MNILVTGANGFVGKAICELGVKAGHNMIACQRNITQRISAEIRLIPDINDISSLVKAMDGCEVVIHLVARTHTIKDTSENKLLDYRKINVMGTKAISNAAKQAKVRRIVFMSSIKVHGDQNYKSAFTERSPIAPSDAYGTTKQEAETALRELCDNSNIEWCILRPPLIYGPGVKGNFQSLIRLCDTPLPLPFGLVRNKRSIIGVNNLASAALSAATHPNAVGKIFLVRDAEDISTTKLIKLIRSELGRPACLVSIPPKLMNLGLTILGKRGTAIRLFGSLTINDSLIRNCLGWYPELDINTVLKNTIKSWQRQNKII